MRSSDWSSDVCSSDLDREGFEAAMAEQRRAARAAWKGSGDKASDELWFDLVEEKGGTEFVGYTSEQGEGEIIAIVRDGARVDRAGMGDTVDIVTNQTPFYGESGGQVGDAGIFSNDDGLRAIVADTKKHLGRGSGRASCGERGWQA